MRSNLKNGIVGLCLAGVLAVGVCCTGFASRDDNGKWFGNGNLSTWHWSDKKNDNTLVNPDDKKPDDPTTGDDTEKLKPTSGTSGFTLPETVNGRGIEAECALISVLNYEDYGISAQAESAYTITAAIVPAYAENQNVTWGLVKEDSSDPWWSGKNLDDYVTLTADGLTASVTCKQAFGAKISAIVTSEENPEAYASVPLNYRKRIKSISGANTFSGFSDSAAAKVNCTVTPVYSDYTIDDTFTLTITAQLTNTNTINAIKSYASSNVTSSTTLGNTLIQGLSTEAKTLTVSAGQIPNLASAEGFFSTFYAGTVSVSARNQALNLFKAAIDNQHSLVYSAWGTVTYTYKSAYSTKTATGAIEVTAVSYHVTGVTTDKSDGIIF